MLGEATRTSAPPMGGGAPSVDQPATKVLGLVERQKCAVRRVTDERDALVRRHKVVDLRLQTWNDCLSCRVRRYVVSPAALANRCT